jgi:hypothetical protein
MRIKLGCSPFVFSLLTPPTGPQGFDEVTRRQGCHGVKEAALQGLVVGVLVSLLLDLGAKLFHVTAEAFDRLATAERATHGDGSTREKCKL